MIPDRPAGRAERPVAPQVARALPPEMLREIQALSRAVLELGLRLYAQLRSQPGNLVFSPWSVFSSLALACAGARGPTREEILRMLGVELEEDALHRTTGVMREFLQGSAASGAAEIRTGCRIWPRQGRSMLDEFAVVSRLYGDGDSQPLDFAGDPGGAAGVINAWVSAMTAGRIKTLVNAGSLARETEMVLGSAAYFRGSWLEAFDRGKTADGQFWVDPQRSVQVPMMRQKSSLSRLSLQQRLSVLEKPYRGGTQALSLVLPRSLDGLPGLESDLTSEMLESCLHGLHQIQAEVWLPRFSCESELPLVRHLSVMGMDVSLTPRADFSRLCESGGLFINDVSHRSLVEVNEKGTVAAAATRICLVKCGPMEFKADHPFLFFIRDLSTDLMLFMGRVENPVA